MTNLFEFSEKIWYYNQLTIFAILCIIISILTYFLILKVSSSRLGHYRYYLLNITTWNLILCIDSAILTRKDFEQGVANAPVIRGPVKYLGQYLAHAFTVVEHIATAQVGIAIVICCFFKFLHLVIFPKLKREMALKMVVCLTILGHGTSILLIGKEIYDSLTFLRDPGDFYVLSCRFGKTKNHLSSSSDD